MATDYGLDVSTYPDLDPSFVWISGTMAMAEAIARRLETKAGTLAYDPSYGFDARQWVNEDFGPHELFVLQAQIQAQCVLEERVLSASVTVTSNAASQSLAIAIALVLDEGGAFTLTLSIDRVQASILRVEAA